MYTHESIYIYIYIPTLSLLLVYVCVCVSYIFFLFQTIDKNVYDVAIISNRVKIYICAHQFDEIDTDKECTEIRLDGLKFFKTFQN